MGKSIIIGSTRLTEYVKDFISKDGNPYKLKYSLGDDNRIEDYVLSFDKTPYPYYGGATVLGIAIHGWHGYDITLKNYKETSTGFSGTLAFHYYDHFGLDSEDEIIHVGFCDWFTLQHYDGLNGRYVPFITNVDINVDFSGKSSKIITNLLNILTLMVKL